MDLNSLPTTLSPVMAYFFSNIRTDQELIFKLDPLVKFIPYRWAHLNFIKFFEAALDDKNWVDNNHQVMTQLFFKAKELIWLKTDTVFSDKINKIIKEKFPLIVKEEMEHIENGELFKLILQAFDNKEIRLIINQNKLIEEVKVLFIYLQQYHLERFFILIESELHKYFEEGQPSAKESYQICFELQDLAREGIKFPTPLVQQGIDYALNQSMDASFFLDQSLSFVQEIQELNLSHLEGESLFSYMKKLPPNLIKLNLSGCQSLNNIVPLKKCKFLTHLNLSDCTSLRNIVPLAHLNLKVLNLRGCLIDSNIIKSYLLQFEEKKDPPQLILSEALKVSFKTIAQEFHRTIVE